MNKRIGKQTLLLPSAPSIVGYASVVGQKEGEGPLKDCFDLISEDSYFGELVTSEFPTIQHLSSLS